MNSASKLDNSGFSQQDSPPINRTDIFPSPSSHTEDLYTNTDRFTWEIIGLSLIIFTLISLLGWFNLTHGKLIDTWVKFIRTWTGLGSLFLIGLVGFLGYFFIIKSTNTHKKFSFSRLLFYEGFIFCLLSLLSILGDHSLPRAKAGLDGGIIGWSIVELMGIIFPQPLLILLLLILLLIFAIYGFGIDHFLQKKIDGWFGGIEKTSSVWIPISNPLNQPNVEELPTKPVPKNPRKVSPGITPATRKTTRDINPARDNALPPIQLLLPESQNPLDEQHIHDTAIIIERTLAEFGIPARVVGYRVGPTVTQFGVEPGFIEKKKPDGTITMQKVRISQIAGLSKDLARALSADRLRIEAPVPGHTFIGIEAPNATSTLVRLRPILESKTFQDVNSSLAIAIGRNVSGQPVVADLARMPHLLIAGTTGSGKSICIQSTTLCLVMNNTPEQLKLVMLDPKMVELVRFNGLPHLLGKVETELDRMIAVLRWAVTEMDNRYKLLEAVGVRDLENYNRKMKRKGEKTLPRIVILIDELADLIMSAPEQVEFCLVRLAQKARATGIHLVIATQRPSTDVLTGVIKANFPARIAFTVATSVDSRVILDVTGAETLLGKGDLLLLNPELGSPIRAQGVFVQDQEIQGVIGYWKSQYPEMQPSQSPWEDFMNDEEEEDNLIDKAIEVIRQTGHASTSLLQRRLKIGYPRAARLMDELEIQGYVGPAQPGGREREIFLSDETGLDNGEQEEDEYNS